MTKSTKTMSLRINNEVYDMFSDVCNNEGVTIAQKMKQLVTDCITPSCKTENKSELTGNIDEDRKILDSMTREDLGKSLRILDSTPRKTLDQKIRVLDSKNRKKIESELN
jgi:hypothetical protein